uniref:Uncharacterized protein n=1 Tax=Anguilla anguilla TaxID=7936 RepID=A0A0E9XDV3_ANGAN
MRLTPSLTEKRLLWPYKFRGSHAMSHPRHQRA